MLCLSPRHQIRSLKEWNKVNIIYFIWFIANVQKNKETTKSIMLWTQTLSDHNSVWKYFFRYW